MKPVTCSSIFLFVQLSKEYGSVFTVHFGPNNVVVLAGYKAVKEALVGNAEEFGDRDIAPMFYEANRGHGTSLHFAYVDNFHHSDLLFKGIAL